MGTERIHNIYGEIANRFALSTDVVEAYIVENTLRTRHPTTTEPQTFQNGYFELISLLAEKLRG
jgi:hypothetical protein